MLCRIVLRIFIRIDGSIDIHLAVERTTVVVVASIDARPVATYQSIFTAPVHIGFIDITSYIVLNTIGSTEDILKFDCRAYRHIDHRAAGDSLLIATAIDSLQLTTGKVNNGRGFVRLSFNVNRRIITLLFLMINQKRRGNAHADTATLTGTEDFHTLIGCQFLWNIDEHIAAVLHQVLFFLTHEALTGTVNLSNGITLGVSGSEVNKGIIQERLGIA